MSRSVAELIVVWAAVITLWVWIIRLILAQQPRRRPAAGVRELEADIAGDPMYESPRRERTDLQPSAFDRLVGVHGYQRPVYELPAAPPPPPPPPAMPHEGATEEWAAVLHELPQTATGVNLQGQDIGSADWWSSADTPPDGQWWGEWQQMYVDELHLIERCHQAAIDEAFEEIARGMCATPEELDAFVASYQAKVDQLREIDEHAAELVGAPAGEA